MPDTTDDTQDLRYGGLTPSDPIPISNLHVHELTPGQKQELQIKLAKGMRLSQDIALEIKQLEKDKRQAALTKKINLVSQIAGLQSQLVQLELEIAAQIKRLKEQLLVTPPAINTLLNKIKKDCASYLKQVSQAQAWLYRGAEGPDVFVGKSWLTRKAKDSKPQAQVLFDQMLAQLGFVALRGNSIFATSSFKHTQQFGSKTYVIFPIDNASHFTYTNQQDLTLDTVMDVATSPDKSRKFKKQLLGHVQDTLRALDDNQIPNSLVDLKNMLVDGYYGWSRIQEQLQQFVQTGVPHKIPEMFLDPEFQFKMGTLDYFVEKWHPQQTDLSKALNLQLEVYVSGAYYAVNTAMYAEYIERKFGVPVMSKHKQKPVKW